MNNKYKNLGIMVDMAGCPNLAEPAPWWKLGNLKSDGVNVIMQRYLNDDAPGLNMNNTVLISELAHRFGSSESQKHYTKGDLMCRFMHQWGIEYMERTLK